ncbi:MADF domain-containing protein [Plasmodiophora brassicae]|uniref:Uncharacterized protein n=1 Tax=Plasmodiophora brassicae TaxID=37360 RepID=A0A0G4IUI9_PLABS|nr:hypothetical protein PBRA_006913 [Plasmodiophora brassicae]SPR00576.1 unnamed protein product [Plasmodiophora brassicae]
MASPSEPEPGQQVCEQRPTRKRAFRFKVHHDVHLLKEVMVHQPWAALPHRDIKAKWKMIADGVSNYAKCPARPVATRRRFDALIAAFRNKQMDLLRAAGAEEEFDERARLLANVEQQVSDAERKPVVLIWGSATPTMGVTVAHAATGEAPGTRPDRSSTSTNDSAPAKRPRVDDGSAPGSRADVNADVDDRCNACP